MEDQEEEQVSETYIKGFNDGYIIAKHEPELIEQLLGSDIPDQEYKHALENGSRQNQKEVLMDQMKKQVQGKDKSKGRGI